MWHIPVREEDLPDITSLAERLNARLSEASYAGRAGTELARLPDLRKQILPRANKSRAGVFNIPKPDKPRRGWTFHYGGSKELQFNVGYVFIGDDIKLRHGVCFSLETTANLHFPLDEVGPLIPHFNDYIGKYPRGVEDFLMWSEKDQQRSSPRPAGRVLDEEVEVGTFIFMGGIASADPSDAEMDDMFTLYDRLIPLYAYVMGRGLADCGGGRRPISGKRRAKGS